MQPLKLPRHICAPQRTPTPPVTISIASARKRTAMRSSEAPIDGGLTSGRAHGSQHVPATPRPSTHASISVNRSLNEWIAAFEDLYVPACASCDARERAGCPRVVARSVPGNVVLGHGRWAFRRNPPRIHQAARRDNPPAHYAPRRPGTSDQLVSVCHTRLVDGSVWRRHLLCGFHCLIGVYVGGGRRVEAPCSPQTVLSDPHLTPPV